MTPHDTREHQSENERRGRENGSQDSGQGNSTNRLEQAARSVMQPDANDPDFRYYLTAWHS